jgi:hypothetical protein
MMVETPDTMGPEDQAFSILHGQAASAIPPPLAQWFSAISGGKRRPNLRRLRRAVNILEVISSLEHILTWNGTPRNWAARRISAVHLPDAVRHV